MTTDPPEEADVPDAVRAQWDELVALAPQMVAAFKEYDRRRRRCRELVVELLRGGVRRRILEGVPFSRALVARIGQREHIPTERRRRAS